MSCTCSSVASRNDESPSCAAAASQAARRSLYPDSASRRSTWLSQTTIATPSGIGMWR
jgi:hypothetical protein